jgi:F-type H+-transporting ATPase subunit epsilon
MDTFQLDIITPNRVAYSQAVESLTVPTMGGVIGVLPRHEHLVTVLTEGEVKIAASGKEYFLAIGGGFMEVTGGKTTILVTRAVHASELNEEEIRRAKEEAERALSQLSGSKASAEELSAAQAMLRRSLLELKVARRRVGHRFPSSEH